MKVLMVSKAMVMGAYHSKLEELARLGARVSLVVPSHWGSQKAERIYAKEYDISAVPCIWSGKNHFHFYPGLAGFLTRDKWDIVHIDEEPFSVVTFQAMRLCAKLDCPTLFFTWQNLMKWYPPPFGLLERHNFACAHGAMAGNEEAQGILRKRGFKKRVWVVPQFGVDPQRFRKGESSDLRRDLRLEGSFVVGYIGRMVEEKGLDTLVKALTSLPDCVVLVMIGSGNHQLSLQRLADELGVGLRIRWVAGVASIQVPEYVNAVDVLVLPSKTRHNWKEQFGRVLIEAMSCGVPVVGSDSGEIPRVIDDAGLIFPEGDSTALSSCISRLMNDGVLRERLSFKGRERVLQNYTQERIARQTLHAYECLLQGGSCELA